MQLGAACRLVLLQLAKLLVCLTCFALDRSHGKQRQRQLGFASPSTRLTLVGATSTLLSTDGGGLSVGTPDAGEMELKRRPGLSPLILYLLRTGSRYFNTSFAVWGDLGTCREPEPGTGPDAHWLSDGAALRIGSSGAVTVGQVGQAI